MEGFTVSARCIGVTEATKSGISIRLLSGCITAQRGDVKKLIVPDHNCGYFPEGVFVEIFGVTHETKPEENYRGVLFVECDDISEEKMEMIEKWDEVFFFNGVQGTEALISVAIKLEYRGVTLVDDGTRKQVLLTPVGFETRPNPPYGGEAVWIKGALTGGLKIEVKIPNKILSVWPSRWRDLPGAVLAARVTAQQHEKKTPVVRRW